MIWRVTAPRVAQDYSGTLRAVGLCSRVLTLDSARFAVAPGIDERCEQAGSNDGRFSALYLPLPMDTDFSYAGSLTVAIWKL